MLYKEGARVLECVKQKKGSVKSLVLSSKYKNIKQLYALVCETLKYREVILEILEVTEFLANERKYLKTEELAIVLVYDFLFGKGIHSGLQQTLKDAVDRHKSSLNAALAKIKVKHKITLNEDLIKIGKNGQTTACLPRYVRVNLIKTTVADVCKFFEEREGYSQKETDGLSYEQYIETVNNLSAKSFLVDAHVPHVLVFSHGTDFHDHPLYLSGDIILQDKASCIPAHCLQPPVGANVFDTCAAPGNKTSHLASIMGNKGKIFSFDLDPKRAATMKKLLTSAKVRCSEVKVMDFLKVKTDDPLYKNVHYAVVDPSCSGSGIVNRLDHLTNDEESQNNKRLDNLAAFQSSILIHTLSFENMKKVVYSTCSIHEQENEKVVEKVLKKCGTDFELEEILPSIPSRGHRVFPGAEKTVRLDPQTDATNGFFVATFRRKNHENATVISAEHIVDCNNDVNDASGNHGNRNAKKRKRSKTQQCENVGTLNSKHKHLKKEECVNNSTKIQNNNTTSHKKKKRKRKPMPVTGKS